MTDQTVLIVAGVAGVALVFVAAKILGDVLKALVVGAVAAVALFLLLPRLEAQGGAVGEAARKVREVTDDPAATVRELRDKAKGLGLAAPAPDAGPAVETDARSAPAEGPAPGS